MMYVGLTVLTRRRLEEGRNVNNTKPLWNVPLSGVSPTAPSGLIRRRSDSGKFPPSSPSSSISVSLLGKEETGKYRGEIRKAKRNCRISRVVKEYFAFIRFFPRRKKIQSPSVAGFWSRIAGPSSSSFSSLLLGRLVTGSCPKVPKGAPIESPRWNGGGREERKSHFLPSDSHSLARRPPVRRRRKKTAFSHTSRGGDGKFLAFKLWPRRVGCDG